MRRPLTAVDDKACLSDVGYFRFPVEADLAAFGGQDVIGDTVLVLMLVEAEYSCR